MGMRTIYLLLFPLYLFFIEGLAHDAFADVCTPGNPRQATEEDILAIYKSLM